MEPIPNVTQGTPPPRAPPSRAPVCSRPTQGDASGRALLMKSGEGLILLETEPSSSATLCPVCSPSAHAGLVPDCGLPPEAGACTRVRSWHWTLGDLNPPLSVSGCVGAEWVDPPHLPHSLLCQDRSHGRS